jgi:bromodomain-containing protein 7/9
LPPQLRDHFTDVVKATITIIRKNDTYHLFQDPVTEESAPGYFEAVRRPMDFGTMVNKLESGQYGNADIGKVFADFLLVLNNCALYNEGNEEVMDEAARLLGILPETYAKACVGILRQKSV